MDRTNTARGSFIYNLGLLFEKASSLYSTRPALILGESETFTYDELDQISSQCARLLVQQGVRRRDVVCISGRKTLHLYACLVACLRIGAPYVVLDEESPAERLRRIVQICRPKALVLDPELYARIEGESGLSADVMIALDEQFKVQLRHYQTGQLDETLAVTGTDVAYIMFTSGSTGFPKGAAISHLSVLNFVEWSRQCFDILPTDVLSGVNPLYFDNSVFDLYSSLMTGAALASFDREQVREPATLVRLVGERSCTIWFSVPSMLIFLSTMKVLHPAAFPSVTRIIFGGEAFPKPKLHKLFEWFGKRARLVNVYGPTECTCICSAYDIDAIDFVDSNSIAPIGRIAPNFSYIILRDGEAVPSGEVGELCLLGPNVGLGYFNDPDRTLESFVENSLNGKYREVMYRTGDLVKCEPSNGMIHFVGRADHQIKHMGYRIELLEIETALNLIPHIEEAAVIHGVINGFSRIVAVVGSQKGITEAEVVRALRAVLPEYMLPQQTIVLVTLPKNKNGKIDRSGLVRDVFKPGNSTP